MSKNLTLISWNVNGLRAGIRKGFLDWLDQASPDVLCIQETKASKEQLGDEINHHEQYHANWHSSVVKKGYSGVLTLSKEKPLLVEQGFGIERFDQEGRVIMTEFKEFILFNVYFPNGKQGIERLNYKMEFYEHFLRHIEAYRKHGKRIVFCGDVNTAHQPIDLARPKANEGVSGFLPIERRWMDRVVEKGYIDTLREFHTGAELYTWWDLKTKARDRNVGWRIDYFFIQKELRPYLKNAYIMPEVMGSDHCPVGIDFSF